MNYINTNYIVLFLCGGFRNIDMRNVDAVDFGSASNNHWVESKLPHGKPRLILCWEVNNCAVFPLPETNFNVVLETTTTILMLSRLVRMEIIYLNHIFEYGTFSHRHHLGCYILRGKLLVLISSGDFWDTFFV